MKLFLHIDPKTIVESHTAPSAPKILDEIDALADTIRANMGKEVRIPKDVLDSFKLKKTLNQDIWEGNTLNPKVRSKLIQVATDFYNGLDLPKEAQIKDIIFTGSLSNFNWSKYSDIDLHIVIDFKNFDADPKMVEDYFYAQKSIWNQEHNINVFGFPVELYVQDINAKLVATAVYSVIKNKWVKIPKREEFDLDKKAIKDKADNIIYKLRDIRQDYQDKQFQSVVDKVTRVKAKIKQMRNAGLEKGGEFSLENLVFKVLRRTPFMDQLDSFKAKAYDKLMSVSEVMTETKKNSPRQPTPEEIKKLFHTNQGFFEPKNAAMYAKKFMGLTLVKVIGYGGNGAAYLTDKGTKLKFTFSENEYDFAKRSIGKRADYMAEYYSAELVYGNIYVIEMEYIDALPEKQKKELEKMFDAQLNGTENYSKELKASVDAIKQRIGPYANDLRNHDNFGLKNGKLATYDPVSESEVMNEDSKIWNSGGVLLIKGEILEDGTQRLYATNITNLLGLDRFKKDNSKGQAARMAVIKNQVFRISVIDGRLKAQGVAWKSNDSMLARLGMDRNAVALNNNKTPLHWDSLTFNNIPTALNSISNQILGIPNIKWTN